MPDIAAIIQTHGSNPWAYLPLAVLLGALHALEPGHSKSMMAAFVVATRGTAAQAALLGGSAAIGHSLVVWALAAAGIWLGDALILDKAEPWLILISGLMILGLAWRIVVLFRREHHEHEHHDHDHHDHDHDHHDDHYDERELSHAQEHEREIAERFAGRTVGNGAIAWFGLTAGLMPCPSAVAVLLICLQSRAFTLGFGMVAGFSLGLAITLISVGVLAAWGARKASEGWSGFAGWAERLPYFSAALVALIGVIVTIRGLLATGLI
jgi:nickel/cobalt exporter